MPTLNDLRLKRLQPPETGRLELTDDKAVGLKFRLTPNGRATWSVQVNVHGEKRRFTIGEYPAIGLASALCDAGEPEGVVDRCLNHAATGSAPSAVARVYNRSEMLPQRARVLDRWAAMVLAEEPTGNVVDMRRGA